MVSCTKVADLDTLKQQDTTWTLRQPWLKPQLSVKGPRRLPPLKVQTDPLEVGIGWTPYLSPSCAWQHHLQTLPQCSPSLGCSPSISGLWNRACSCEACREKQTQGPGKCLDVATTAQGCSLLGALSLAPSSPSSLAPSSTGHKGCRMNHEQEKNQGSGSFKETTAIIFLHGVVKNSLQTLKQPDTVLNVK